MCRAGAAKVGIRKLKYFKQEVLKMTGREIINLIEKLEEEGMSSDKIIEIIKYIEKHEPEKE